MKVFKYLANKSLKEMYDIYVVVQELKPYAISKYKSGWEDALDEAFFHILENFNGDKGDLENYATKVVGTILLNKYKKELANDEQTTIDLDIKAAKEYDSEELLLVLDEDNTENLRNCKRDLAKLFGKDFKFFVTGYTRDKELDYAVLFTKYNFPIVKEAQKYLCSTYRGEATNFLHKERGRSLRNFEKSKLLKYQDSGMEYLGSLNGIVMVRRKQGFHLKKVYKLRVSYIVDCLIHLYYLEEGDFTFLLEDTKVYLTLSGKFVNDMESLRENLEIELIGNLLTKTQFKVFYYDKGNEILLSNTTDEHRPVIVESLGKEIPLSLERMVVKEVR